MAFLVELEQFHGLGLHRQDPFVVALTDDPDRPVGEIEAGDPEVSDLLGPCARVVEENEKSEIPKAIGARGLRLLKQRLKLRGGQEIGRF